MIQDPLLVLAFMLGVVAFTRWLEECFDWVKKISSAVVCTLLGIALANMGVIAHTGPMHDAVFTFAIPYAIVLVIIGTDMRELTNAGRCRLIGAAQFATDRIAKDQREVGSGVKGARDDRVCRHAGGVDTGAGQAIPGKIDC